MALAVIFSRAQTGIDTPLVTVEADLAPGLPSMTLVGLPEAAVRESRDRVRSALINSGFDFPAGRITLNLAPADLPKAGGRFDLPLALGILAASGQIPHQHLDQFEFAGELALSGALRAFPGVLAMMVGASQSGRRLIVPDLVAVEASALSSIPVLLAGSLLEVCAFLSGRQSLRAPTPLTTVNRATSADLAEVRGQLPARRVLEIAAAGRHSLLFSGPPGTGKSMLACRLPSILPELTEEQARQLAVIGSLANQSFDASRWRQPPFRAPHHTASAVALVGGGGEPKPGEISLAHQGVLFLDELPEFDRKVLEVLREPLEQGQIAISRAARQVCFPANFQLIAAMNPCPCGYLGHPSGRCHCSPDQISRYRARISGPLLERIDMMLEMSVLPAGALTQMQPGEASEPVRQRVELVRSCQLQRQQRLNSQLSVTELEQQCQLDKAGRLLLTTAIERMALSARACHRILRVARTIADMAGCEQLVSEHLAEAIQYRRLPWLNR